MPITFKDNTLGSNPLSTTKSYVCRVCNLHFASDVEFSVHKRRFCLERAREGAKGNRDVLNHLFSDGAGGISVVREPDRKEAAKNYPDIAPAQPSNKGPVTVQILSSLPASSVTSTEHAKSETKDRERLLAERQAILDQLEALKYGETSVISPESTETVLSTAQLTRASKPRDIAEVGHSVLNDINALRTEYLRNGGGNPAVLAQIRQLEVEAAQLQDRARGLGMSLADISGDDTENGESEELELYKKGSTRLVKSNTTEDEDSLLVRKWKTEEEQDLQKMKLQHKKLMLKLQQEREKIVTESELEKLKR
ncbi:hypothetical protein HK104_001825, partial [Borealophlyctis nickersoniae]